MKPVIFFLLLLAPLFLIGCDSGSRGSDDDKSSLNSGSNQTPPTLAETKIIKMYASSSEGGARSPDYANDDDLASLWKSNFYEDDEESPIWIYADLGSNHYVKKVILHLGIYANDDAFPSGFEFQ